MSGKPADWQDCNFVHKVLIREGSLVNTFYQGKPGKTLAMACRLDDCWQEGHMPCVLRKSRPEGHFCGSSMGDYKSELESDAGYGNKQTLFSVHVPSCITSHCPR